MKTSQIIIPVDTEKLSALRQYAAKKGISLEAELTGAVDRLYEKLVPPAVREYIEQREQRDAAPTDPPRAGTRSRAGAVGVVAGG